MANEPQTIWRTTDGHGEAINPGVDFIVDTTGTFLVDTIATNVVDTGTDFIIIPQTAWSQDDSK